MLLIDFLMCNFYISAMIKGKFIIDNNLLGFSMWDIEGDSADILLDAISSGMGIQQCT